MISNAPLVSIITPVYNSEIFIKATIESVLAQSFTNWELILINDCSTDSSKVILEMYERSDKRIKLVNMAGNGGAARARNRGIEFSQGRFIAFLDSDDLWAKDKLEYQINYMLVNSVDFSFTSYDKMNDVGAVFEEIGVPERVTYQQLLKIQVIGCLTAVYDTQHFGKIYMPDIRKRQDWGLWLTLLKKTKYAYGIQKSLAHYRVLNNSLSSNKLNSAVYTWKLFRDVEKLGIFRAIFYFSSYAVTSSLRSKWPSVARKLGFLH